MFVKSFIEKSCKLVHWLLFLGSYRYYGHLGLRPTFLVFCGTTLPANPVYVNDNLALVRFQSYPRVNAARNFSGFSLNYKSGIASQAGEIDSTTFLLLWLYTCILVQFQYHVKFVLTKAERSLFPIALNTAWLYVYQSANYWFVCHDGLCGKHA